MTTRFAYVYFMTDRPDAVRATAPAHAEHWRRLALAGYSGGPFEDRSGGLIVFDAEDREQAQQAVEGDPFLRSGLLQARWLKPWAPVG